MAALPLDRLLTLRRSSSSISRAQPRSRSLSGNVMSNDPTSVAARRCLELGGTTSACLGSRPPRRHRQPFDRRRGPRRDHRSRPLGCRPQRRVRRQRYHPERRLLGRLRHHLQLRQAGPRRSQLHAGKVSRRSEGYGCQRFRMAPLFSPLRSDGSPLAGPTGAVTVAGRVITGYNTVTSTQMVNGVRAAPNQCNGPCQTVQPGSCLRERQGDLYPRRALALHRRRNRRPQAARTLRPWEVCSARSPA